MATDAGSIIYTIDADTSGLLLAERSVGRSTGAIVRSLSKIASGVSIGLLVMQLVKVQRKFDKLNAAILTSTGSIKGAGIAFDALEKFAAKTPFALSQSVTAFTKLVNFGLTPSERAMMSFGDTASAMGKSLEDMIEAVADAATGEFERLKEFGIKSKNQGDTIAFTFRGMTKVVKNSAADIEEFLIKLGENNFAGAMANQMDTLDGAISNLGDTWDGLLRTVSDQGFNTVMTSAVRNTTTAIQELIDLLKSGQLDGFIELIATSWRNSFSMVAKTISNLTDFAVSEFEALKSAGADVPDFISDAFFNLPANIKAAIQIAAIEIGSFVTKAKAMAKQLEIDLNPWSDGDGTLEQDLKVAESARLEAISAVIGKRDEEIKSIGKLRQSLVLLRKDYDDAASAVTGDALAQFKVKTDGSTAAPTAAETQLATKVSGIQASDIGLDPTAALALRQEKEFDLLKLGFENKEGLEQEFLDRSTELNKQHAAQKKALDDKGNSELMASLQAVEDQTVRSLAGLITGATTGREAMAGLANVILNEAVGGLVRMGIETVKNQVLGQALESSKQAGIVATNAVGMTATAASTAATVAAAGTVAVASAPAAALTSTFSFGSAAIIGGAALLGTIALAKAGSRRHGGPVSAGKQFLVGENGPEMFTPGKSGRISSNEDTFGGGGFQQTVIIENNTPSNVSTQTSDDGKQLKIIINEVARQISTNQGVIPKAMRQSTNTTFKTSR